MDSTTWAIIRTGIVIVGVNIALLILHYLQH
jgi:hypothetical protein